METTARTESRSFADPRYQGYQILHVGLTAGSIPFGLDIFEPHGDLGQISGTVDRANCGECPPIHVPARRACLRRHNSCAEGHGGEPISLPCGFWESSSTSSRIRASMMWRCATSDCS